MKRRPLRVKRWEAKVRRYDEDDVRVDTWMTTVEAKTEPAAEQAALAAYGARPPSLDARSIAVLAGAARHGSRMHDPRCGATRLLWHRQSRHLASIHAPLRRGGHPRTALDRRRASNHAPARGDAAAEEIEASWGISLSPRQGGDDPTRGCRR